MADSFSTTSHTEDRAIRELEIVLDSVSELASTNVSLRDFFVQMLDGAVTALGARAGIVHVPLSAEDTPEGTWQAICGHQCDGKATASPDIFSWTGG